MADDAAQAAAAGVGIQAAVTVRAILAVLVEAEIAAEATAPLPVRRTQRAGAVIATVAIIAAAATGMVLRMPVGGVVARQRRGAAVVHRPGAVVDGGSAVVTRVVRGRRRE